VQMLARQAVREVREAVTGTQSPNLEAELAAAELALRTAGIDVHIEGNGADVDPVYQTTLAWAVREAATNVVKHSGARTCRIALRRVEGLTSLEVEDDGQGLAQSGGTGTGLRGLADRVSAQGGLLEVGSREGSGFRLRVQLGAAVARPANGAVTP